MTLDTSLFFWLNNWAGQSRAADAVIIFLAQYLPYLLVAAFLLFVIFSSTPKPERIRMFWIASLSALIARLGVTEFIRFFYHRPRPFLAHRVHQLIAENGWSFPSGHSAFFFALATAIYCYNKKWGIGFFIASIIMNVSRIAAGVHYPSDIIGGMLIGIAVGLAVVKIGSCCAQEKKDVV